MRPATKPLRYVIAVAVLAGALLTAPTAAARPTCFGREATIVSNADTIYGTRHADVIVGGPSINTIYGRRGNDRICSRGDEETVKGGRGNDRLDGGEGNDALSGGRGNRDRVAFASEASVDVDLRIGLAFNSADDTLSGIENVTGTSGNDTIRGDANRNALDGARGDDSVRGRGARDRISGGLDDDTLLGQTGDDILTGGPDTDTNNGGPGVDLCNSGETNTGCELIGT